MKEKVEFLRSPPLPAATGHNKGSPLFHHRHDKYYYIFLLSTLDLTKLILLICIKLVLQRTEEYCHYCNFFFFFHIGRVLDEELIVGFDSSGSTSWVQRLLWRREDGSVRNKGVCEVQPQCHRSSSPFMGWWPWEWLLSLGAKVTCDSTTGHVTHFSLHNVRELKDPLFSNMGSKRFSIWHFQRVTKSWFIL